MNRVAEKLVAGGTVLLGVLIGAGATQMKGAEGYSVVGTNFLPTIVAALVILCGLSLLKEAFSGGFQNMPEESDTTPRPDWRGMVWLSVGLLLSAASISTVGFVPSCTALFVLAARGFRLSMGAGPASISDWLRDVVTGAALSLPVYWLFTKLLGLTLPGLTSTGWI